MPTLSIHRQDGSLAAQATHPQEAMLYYNQAYEPGDIITLELEPGLQHCYLTIDQAIPQGLIYLPEGKMRYTIPFGEATLAHPPTAFTGTKHLITARPALESEWRAYRNIAENPIDQRGDVTAYPHATANVETRNESVFAARNVIDGIRISDGHGNWPYQSWGIGARTDAVLTLDFGGPVTIDRIALYLRADFPHDAYWVEATLLLSDGTEHVLPLIKTAEPQVFDIGQHSIQWLKLDRLIKCDMPSAFPALTELQVFGRREG